VRRWLEALVRRASPGLREARLAFLLDALRDGRTVLDVGVWTRQPEPNPGENWLEKHAPEGARLVAVGLEDMRAFRRAYPRVTCVQADGAALPFGDRAVDFAAANAVLEHVGDVRHVAFARELARAGRAAWLAVPDRCCPVEVHTRLPLVHWLPGWRALFRLLGQPQWARPEALQLFTRRRLARVLRETGRTWTIRRQRAWGVPVSLIATCETPRDRGEGAS
jgi:hypothetical protein